MWALGNAQAMVHLWRDFWKQQKQSSLDGGRINPGCTCDRRGLSVVLAYVAYKYGVCECSVRFIVQICHVESRSPLQHRISQASLLSQNCHSQKDMVKGQ